MRRPKCKVNPSSMQEPSNPATGQRKGPDRPTPCSLRKISSRYLPFRTAAVSAGMTSFEPTSRRFQTAWRRLALHTYSDKSGYDRDNCTTYDDGTACSPVTFRTCSSHHSHTRSPMAGSCASGCSGLVLLHHGIKYSPLWSSATEGDVPAYNWVAAPSWTGYRNVACSCPGAVSVRGEGGVENEHGARIGQPDSGRAASIQSGCCLHHLACQPKPSCRCGKTQRRESARTWVQARAVDARVLVPPGELVGEEDVADLALVVLYPGRVPFLAPASTDKTVSMHIF